MVHSMVSKILQSKQIYDVAIRNPPTPCFPYYSGGFNPDNPVLRLRLRLSDFPFPPVRSIFNPSLLNLLDDRDCLGSTGSGVPACDLIVGIGLTRPWNSFL